MRKLVIFATAALIQDTLAYDACNTCNTGCQPCKQQADNRFPNQRHSQSRSRSRSNGRVVVPCGPVPNLRQPKPICRPGNFELPSSPNKRRFNRSPSHSLKLNHQICFDNIPRPVEPRSRSRSRSPVRIPKVVGDIIVNVPVQRPCPRANSRPSRSSNRNRSNSNSHSAGSQSGRSHSAGSHSVRSNSAGSHTHEGRRIVCHNGVCKSVHSHRNSQGRNWQCNGCGKTWSGNTACGHCGTHKPVAPKPVVPKPCY